MFSSLAGRQTVSHIFANRIVNLVELLIGNLQEPWLCGEETMISTPAQFVHMRTPHSPSNSGFRYFKTRTEVEKNQLTKYKKDGVD